MMVIAGNSIAELEKDLEMLKLALASGKACGVGGSSLSEVEKGLTLMKNMMNEAERAEEEEVISELARQMIETILRGT